MERTLAIIKPDAVAAGFAGPIITAIEQSGLKIAGLKMVWMDIPLVHCFYAVHQGKYFIHELAKFMSEGPIIVLVLSGDDAIGRWRKLMGATDPVEAETGTIRKLYGVSMRRNAVHGSDGRESAEREIAFFFNAIEVIRG